MHNQTFVKMGYVRGAFGIKGWIKITADTEYVDSLLDYPLWFLGKNDSWQEYKLTQGKITPDGLVVKLEGIDDRDTAHSLKGKTIAVTRDQFKPTEEDEFYWADLIGLQVENPRGVVLGTVKDLMETGVHDILVLKSTEKDILIPFVGKFILDVDLKAKRILADWELDY